jgi:saccharopine dehydrogenase-like NADP-dependent oxidoreductase
MKFTLLGGAGNVALATMRDLLEIDDGEVTEIILADRRFEEVHARVRATASGKVKPAAVDTIPDGLVELVRGSDVVINKAHARRLQPIAKEAAPEARLHYIDLGTFPEF